MDSSWPKNRELDGDRIHKGKGQFVYFFWGGWHLSAYCEVQGIFGVGREPKLFDRRKQRCGLLLSVLLQLVTVSDVISFSDALSSRDPD